MGFKAVRKDKKIANVYDVLSNFRRGAIRGATGIDDLLGLSDDTPNGVPIPRDMTADFMSNEMESVLSGMDSPISNTVDNGTRAPGGHLTTKFDDLLSADDLLFGSPSHPGDNTSHSAQNYDNGSSFSETWNKMFGGENKSEAAPSNDDGSMASPTNFLPSDLIDSFASLDPYAAPGSADTQRYQVSGLLEGGAIAAAAQAQATPQPGAKKAAGKPSDGNHSTWLNLFSDLDPLGNPDAIGKGNEESDAKRSC